MWSCNGLDSGHPCGCGCAFLHLINLIISSCALDSKESQTKPIPSVCACIPHPLLGYYFALFVVNLFTPPKLVALAPPPLNLRPSLVFGIRLWNCPQRVGEIYPRPSRQTAIYYAKLLSLICSLMSLPFRHLTCNHCSPPAVIHWYIFLHILTGSLPVCVLHRKDPSVYLHGLLSLLSYLFCACQSAPIYHHVGRAWRDTCRSINIVCISHPLFTP